MNRFAWCGLALLAAAISLWFGSDPATFAAPPSDAAPAPQAAAKSDPALFKAEVKPFLQQYCAGCHNADKAKAKYRVDDIGGDIAAGDDTIRWEKALEMVSLGDMPPQSARHQPTDQERAKLVAWITAELKQIGRGKLDEAMLLPAQGNRVDHEDLFSGKHAGPASSPPRLWRLSPQAYAQILSNDGSDATLEVLSGHGLKDYASLTADEAAVNMMLQTTDLVASFMVGEEITLKRKTDHGGLRSRLEQKPSKELAAFYTSESPADADYAKAVDDGYRAVFERDPRDAERERYLALLRDTSAEAGHQIGTKTMLRAMMMSPEFIYRMELGQGEKLPDGRRMLAPMELAYAIGFAILDSGPDEQLFAAAEEGRLQSRDDVEREVRRLLAIQEDPRNRLYQMDHRWWEFKTKKARLLRFFREYFGYATAADVFKDDTRAADHHPLYLIRDADQLVLYAIEQDKQVLEFLLTTDRYFTCYFGPAEDYFKWRDNQLAKTSKRDALDNQKNAELGVTNPSRYRTHQIPAYNLDRQSWNYEPVQPFKQPVPRAGILTHPAWLVAWSGNFDNDIVRRGKWISEHLLADVVPEIPIGVDAQLSTDTTLTLREKFELKVNNEECWRCHKKMNPLGEAFEMYDDFGRYRESYYYDHEGNLVASPKQLAAIQKKSADPWHADKPEYRLTTKPIVSTGTLHGTGDPRLDGPVENAVDLMHRLAKSDRARQTFVRYAFRYWMGRNETLDDSPTLIAADKAYVQSDGSFNELLVSLLTSDSFLYRK